MAKSAAEKQKAYRDRKRNAVTPEIVTRVTDNGDSNAPDILAFGGPDCQCRHCQQNRRQGSRHVLNHGPYKSARVLASNELNRVPLPGDPDYVWHEGTGLQALANSALAPRTQHE